MLMKRKDSEKEREGKERRKSNGHIFAPRRIMTNKALNEIGVFSLARVVVGVYSDFRCIIWVLRGLSPPDMSFSAQRSQIAVFMAISVELCWASASECCLGWPAS